MTIIRHWLRWLAGLSRIKLEVAGFRLFFFSREIVRYHTPAFALYDKYMFKTDISLGFTHFEHSMLESVTLRLLGTLI